jgi:hypothetical protein
MKQHIRAWVGGAAVLIAVFVPSVAFASGFGQGVFGADVPFGSLTSISIALGGNVSIPLSPSGATFVGSASHTVTVTSLDVVGYMLYAHPTTSTNMTNGSATIPVSGNSSAGALSTGTWGYNTDGSTTDFLGMPLAGALLKDAAGPFKNGDPTSVTYGAVASNTQAAGNYSVDITYTVVAKNP